jgi:hypothetical protein
MDLVHQLADRHAPLACDLVQRQPERLFQAPAEHRPLARR